MSRITRVFVTATILVLTQVILISSSPSFELQRGLELLSGRDFAAALGVFESITNASDRSVAARAVFYAAYCAEKLGRSDGWQGYARVLQEYPEQPQVAPAARKRLTALGHTINGAVQAQPQRTRARLIRKIPTPGFSIPSAFVLSPDGENLYATGGGASFIAEINLRSGKVTHAFPLQSRATTVAGPPDGSRVYSGEESGDVLVIDTRSKNVTRIPLGHMIVHLAVTPDGRWLYIATRCDGLWRMDTNAQTFRLVHASRCPELLAITPDGKSLFVSYQDGGPGGSPGHDAIGQFDAQTGRFKGSITGLDNVGNTIAISPDSRFIWANGGDACWSLLYDHSGCPLAPAGIVNIVDVATRQPVHSITFPQFPPSTIAISPKGNLAAVSGLKLALFDLGYELAWSFNEVCGAVAFSGDGKRLYVGLHDSVAVLEIAD